MNDFINLTKKLGIQCKYFFLLILRSPFEALRAWMMACLMKSTFLCVETKNTEKLLTECMIYGLICGVLFFYNGAIWSIYAAFSAKVEAQLQKMMLSKIMTASPEHVNSHFSGEWITKINSDIHTVFVLMNGPLNIPHVVVSAINLTLSSFLLCRCSLQLFMMTWIFILPHVFINAKVALKSMPGLKKDAQNALSESTSAIMPFITEADTILSYDAGDLMMNICEKSSRKLMNINMGMHMRNIFSRAVLLLLGISGYLLIMFLGFHSIYNGRMSFAELTYSFQERGAVMAAVLMAATCLSNIKANLVCVKSINDTFRE